MSVFFFCLLSDGEERILTIGSRSEAACVISHSRAELERNVNVL